MFSQVSTSHSVHRHAWRGGGGGAKHGGQCVAGGMHNVGGGGMCGGGGVCVKNASGQSPLYSVNSPLVYVNIALRFVTLHAIIIRYFQIHTIKINDIIDLLKSCIQMGIINLVVALRNKNAFQSNANHRLRNSMGYIKSDGQMDGQTDRQTDRQIDTQTWLKTLPTRIRGW